MDDSIYYRDGASAPLADSVLKIARRRIYDLFCEKMGPGPATTIVDIGVSDEENEVSNFLEKLHPHTNMITCVGLGDGQQVKTHFPEVNFVSVSPGSPLPFADKSFDIVYSNAVLEHVGDAQERHRFAAELERIGHRAFVVVPNCWFPIEHHTALPLLHYVPPLFRQVVRRTRMAYWADPDNLEFLSARELKRVWPRRGARVVCTGLPLGPLSSNLALIWRPN